MDRIRIRVRVRAHGIFAWCLHNTFVWFINIIFWCIRNIPDHLLHEGLGGGDPVVGVVRGGDEPKLFAMCEKIDRRLVPVKRGTCEGRA